MDKQAISFVMGKRLKKLREERGLSHDKLIKQLNEQYGISVSRDSLMAYEISDESRAKASKLPNMGMRVEFLYCLADFYGVSLDYLLGKTDVKAADCNLQYISDYIGLSESVLQKMNELELHSRQQPGDILYWPNFLAVFIETLFYGSSWKHLNSQLFTSVSLTLVEERFWEREIDGYKNLLPKEKYKAKMRWEKKEENKSKYIRFYDGFSDEIFEKVVNPSLTMELPIFGAVASQDYLSEKLLRDLYSMAKTLCVKKLEERVNAIEAMEHEEKIADK